MGREDADIDVVVRIPGSECSTDETLASPYRPKPWNINLAVIDDPSRLPLAEHYDRILSLTPSSDMQDLAGILERTARELLSSDTEKASALRERLRATRERVSSPAWRREGPLVSILVGTYNRRKTLARSLRSILAQSYTNWEVPLVQDGGEDVDDIVNTVRLLAGSFGGINLEDISAPRCFEIERKLKEVCDIPIFHDDQHGTAIIVAAALINALKLVNKKIEDITAVFSGAGAAGTAIFKLLKSMGLGDAIICDRKGAICSARTDLNDEKKALLELSNKADKSGSLADVMVGADLFIGVSSPGVVTPEMVKTMAPNPILFPMANPVPEIMPDLAREAGAAVIGTGRSDFPNQINNVLAFPGVFRGAFDVRASDINEEMKLAAARALAQLVSDEELTPDYIIPAPFDQRVCPAVAAAVAQAARDSGVARI